MDAPKPAPDCPLRLTAADVKAIGERLRKDTRRPYAVALYDPETDRWAVRDCVVCYAVGGDCSRHREG